MTLNTKKIVYSLHPLERKVLPVILDTRSISEIAVKSKLSEIEVNTGLQFLETRNYVNIEKLDDIFVGLDKFGVKFVSSDLPEITFLKDILTGPKRMGELSIDKESFGAALGILKKEGLIEISKKGDEMIFSAKEGAKKYVSEHINPLTLFKEDVLKSDMSSKQKDAFESLKRRGGFVREFSKKSFSFNLTKEGETIAKEIKDKYSKLNLLESVDSDMLKTGSWKGNEFRHYDVGVEASYNGVGRRHPMIEANNILRDVFVEMGFKEMEGPMVESAFWNMDTMWIPQDHPARDEQDTFYLEGKGEVPKDVMKKVREMHENGIKRTHTQEGEWSEDITCKRLLRTHSTATTFRTLYDLGKRVAKGENVNGKYFYLANVFRNEAIDATHLAEFYQAEGFIIGDDLSLADLMGFIRDYYAKLGITQIKFKPTFNPYTEPSMEAHYYDPKQNKWYALINSGIFREETLEPLGLKGKRIIAWGMGASRVAALLAKKESMRDITGATCDLEWMKNRPMMQRRIVR